ncbi:uncharacterized protein [Diadema antillarum]|uniref:uncharacterized protein isoform X2 n=1 Tax=Diadema antillarum TaxID=105358 RepID=UPI003A874F5D
MATDNQNGRTNRGYNDYGDGFPYRVNGNSAGGAVSSVDGSIKKSRHLTDDNVEVGFHGNGHTKTPRKDFENVGGGDGKKPRWLIGMIAAAMILAVAGIVALGVGLGLALRDASSPVVMPFVTTRPTTTTGDTEATTAVNMTVTFSDRTFDSKLSDKTSVEYQETEEEFIGAIDEQYKNDASYRGVDVIDIREGSVVIYFSIIFVREEDNSALTSILDNLNDNVMEAVNRISDNVTTDITTPLCDTEPCANEVACENTDDLSTFTCTCEPGFTGRACESDINECTETEPCENEGECTNTMGSFTCTCTDGWQGSNCETDIDECDNDNPCENGATCTNTEGSYLCACLPGWNGNNCQNDINECTEGEPCENEGECTNTMGSFTCICTDGWQGSNCGMDIDECDNDNPCENGATCTNTDGSYLCACLPGWDGDKCQNDIDECNSDNPCENGATCTNTNGSYICACPPGWNGNNCQSDIDECAEDDICSNRGECTNMFGFYSCVCLEGWQGTNCELDVNECETFQPCENGGNCSNTFGSYICSCVDGYVGTNCEFDGDVQKIRAVLTLNGAYTIEYTQPGMTEYNTISTQLTQAVDNVMSSFDFAYFGSSVNTTELGSLIATMDLDFNATNPADSTAVYAALNDAIGNNAYFIALDIGSVFIDLDECDSLNQCENGATCTNTNGSYICACPPGWDGNDCQNDIDECNSDNPCENGATCTNTNGSYICACPPGWNGNNCQSDIDECAEDDICSNRGECTNMFGFYSCVCLEGWQGTNCELDVNECETFQPCENGGNCSNTFGSYICSCVDGYVGTNCEFDGDVQKIRAVLTLNGAYTIEYTQPGMTEYNTISTQLTQAVDNVMSSFDFAYFGSSVNTTELGSLIATMDLDFNATNPADSTAVYAALNDAIGNNAYFIALDIGSVFIDTECGFRPASQPTQSRIIGGSATQPGDWPWMVSLRDRSNVHRCAAVVISETRAITAAHCVDKFESAVLGDLKLSTTSPSHVERDVVAVIHPEYDSTTIDNDIAVVIFENRVQFTNDYIRPICLEELGSTMPYVSCHITGWGHNAEGGHVTDTMQEAAVELFDRQQCRSYYSDRNITASMLCAGHVSGARDTCQGDTGGPLQCQDGDGRFHLVGITSFGYGCGRESYPGVYTNVSGYWDFISNATPRDESVDTVLVEVLSGATANITSPNWPFDYPSYVDQVWIISTPDASALDIFIDFIDIDRIYGVLSFGIGEDSTNSSSMIASSQSELVNYYRINSRTVWMRLLSFSSESYRGFFARFVAINEHGLTCSDQPCSGNNVTSCYPDNGGFSCSCAPASTSYPCNEAKNQPLQSQYGTSCDFDQDLCGWQQMKSDGSDWSYSNVSDGGFIYYASSDIEARIISPKIQPRPGGEHLCLTFRYRLSSSYVGTLSILFLREDEPNIVNAEPLWLETRGTTDWMMGETVLTTQEGGWLIIEATIYYTIDDFIALDYVFATECLINDNLRDNLTISAPTSLASFGFPAEYPVDVSQLWTIAVPEGFGTRFNIVFMSIEPLFDVLNIGTGRDPSQGVILGTFTGQRESGEVVTPEQQTWITFDSDGTITDVGFLITVEPMNTTGQSFTNISSQTEFDIYLGQFGFESIDSPDVPENELKDQVFLWRVSAVSGYQIIVNLGYLDTEYGFDVLTIGTGESPSSPDSQVLARLSGDLGFSIDPLPTHSQLVWLHYTRDKVVDHRGFSLYLRTEAETGECDDGGFRCLLGECINSTLRCNGNYDCDDLTDEFECDVETPSPEECDGFMCFQGGCIDLAALCDGYDDCGDNSDEMYCDLPTTAPDDCVDGFRCLFGECINSTLRCDGNDDCDDFSDEYECDIPTTSPEECDGFMCFQGGCVDLAAFCDGYDDCGDNSDEMYCDIPTTSPEDCVGGFRCILGGCINSTLRCNGNYDCDDYSDEFECDTSTPIPNECAVNEYRCPDGTCLNPTAVCDGRNDCGDFSDEIDCYESCENMEYTDERICDGRIDCSDGRDERNCTINIGPNDSVLLTSDSTNSLDSIVRSWRIVCTDPSLVLIVRVNSVDIGYSGSLTIRSYSTDGEVDAVWAFSSTLNTDFDQPGDKVFDSCNLFIQTERESSYQEFSLEIFPAMPSEIFSCNDRQVLTSKTVCDGFVDCVELGDEQGCGALEMATLALGETTEIQSPFTRGLTPVSYSWAFQSSDGSRLLLHILEGYLNVQNRFTIGTGTNPDDKSTIIYELSIPATLVFGGQISYEVSPPGNSFWLRFEDFSEDTYQASSFLFAITAVSEESLECNSDELSCGGVFSQCYNATDACDGLPNCLDGSDEICDCPSIWQVRCGPLNTCVLRDGLCEPDGTTTEVCGSTPNCTFQCNNGRFIDVSFVCDGFTDCEDNTDELQDCECQSHQFDCGERCIPLNDVCNGHPDCASGVDEENCACQSFEFQCSNGECIPFWSLCNGTAECPDDADELSQNCRECPGNYFLCKDQSACLPRFALCDGSFSCKDGSDEWNCGNDTYNPPIDFSIFNRTQIQTNYTVFNHTFTWEGCGRRPAHEVHRVTHGKDVTSLGDYPWQIVLYVEYQGQLNFGCGGAIISPEWILTAAHCVEYLDLDFAIKAGTLFYAADSPGQTRRVTGVFMHPGYDTTLLLNDIAVLKLESPLVFNDDVQPVCLPTVNDSVKVGSYITMTGWGSLIRRYSASPLFLQEVRMPVIPNEVCSKYSPFGYVDSVEIPSSMFCSMYHNGYQGICTGDSGGPVVQETNGQWTVYGVNSWGEACGEAYIPNGYTRVTSYLDFITYIIETN